MFPAVLWVSCRTTDRQQNIDNSFASQKLPTWKPPNVHVKGITSPHPSEPWWAARTPSANQVSPAGAQKGTATDVQFKCLQCPKQRKGTKGIAQASQTDLSGVQTCGFGVKISEITLLFSSCYLWSFRLDSLSLSRTNFLFRVTVCQFVVASLARFLRSRLQRATLDVSAGRLKTSFCNLRSCAHHLEPQEGEEFPLVVGSVGQMRTFESKNKASDPS